jgi:hypothetical protein
VSSFDLLKKIKERKLFAFFFFRKIGTLILKILRTLRLPAPLTNSNATAWHFPGEWGIAPRGIIV